MGKLHLKPSDGLTSDVVYKSLLEVKKSGDVWTKYYFISVALLVMASVGAITEFSLFGGKFGTAFFTPLAICYFSVCTVAYTSFELKNRFYKSFFRRLANGADPAQRVDLMLRYPLAFGSQQFIPHDLVPANVTFGLRHVLGLLPALTVLGLGLFVSIFGLMILLLYDLYLMISTPSLPQVVKVATSLGFLGSMAMSGQLLRNPAKKKKYVVGEKAKMLADKKASGRAR